MSDDNDHANGNQTDNDEQDVDVSIEDVVECRIILIRDVPIELDLCSEDDHDDEDDEGSTNTNFNMCRRNMTKKADVDASVSSIKKESSESASVLPWSWPSVVKKNEIENPSSVKEGEEKGEGEETTFRTNLNHQKDDNENDKHPYPNVSENIHDDSVVGDGNGNDDDGGEGDGDSDGVDGVQKISTGTCNDSSTHPPLTATKVDDNNHSSNRSVVNVTKQPPSPPPSPPRTRTRKVTMVDDALRQDPIQEQEQDEIHPCVIRGRSNKYFWKEIRAYDPLPTGWMVHIHRKEYASSKQKQTTTQPEKMKELKNESTSNVGVGLGLTRPQQSQYRYTYLQFWYTITGKKLTSRNQVLAFLSHLNDVNGDEDTALRRTKDRSYVPHTNVQMKLKTALEVAAEINQNESSCSIGGGTDSGDGDGGSGSGSGSNDCDELKQKMEITSESSRIQESACIDEGMVIKNEIENRHRNGANPEIAPSSPLPPQRDSMEEVKVPFSLVSPDIDHHNNESHHPKHAGGGTTRGGEDSTSTSSTCREERRGRNDAGGGDIFQRKDSKKDGSSSSSVIDEKQLHTSLKEAEGGKNSGTCTSTPYYDGDHERSESSQKKQKSHHNEKENEGHEVDTAGTDNDDESIIEIMDDSDSDMDDGGEEESPNVAQHESREEQSIVQRDGSSSKKNENATEAAYPTVYVDDDNDSIKNDHGKGGGSLAKHEGNPKKRVVSHEEEQNTHGSIRTGSDERSAVGRDTTSCSGGVIELIDDSDSDEEESPKKKNIAQHESSHHNQCSPNKDSTCSSSREEKVIEEKSPTEVSIDNGQNDKDHPSAEENFIEILDDNDDDEVEVQDEDDVEIIGVNQTACEDEGNDDDISKSSEQIEYEDRFGIEGEDYSDMNNNDIKIMGVLVREDVRLNLERKIKEAARKRQRKVMSQMKQQAAKSNVSNQWTYRPPPFYSDVRTSASTKQTGNTASKHVKDSGRSAQKSNVSDDPWPKKRKRPVGRSSSQKKNKGVHRKDAYYYHEEEALREQERLFRESAARVRAREQMERQMKMGQEGFSTSSSSMKTYTEVVMDVSTLPNDHFKWACLYSRLGVPRNSSFSVVKKNYRKLCLLYHPDKARCEDAPIRFQAIKEAYETIMNETNS